jgi:hypothetical protein
MRLVAMIVIMLSAFFTTSRLQVNEHARFVTKSGEVFEGRVSRVFMSGDYRIEQAGKPTRYVPFEEFGAMSFEGSAIPLTAGAVGFFILFIAVCVGFGVDKLLFERFCKANHRGHPL